MINTNENAVVERKMFTPPDIIEGDDLFDDDQDFLEDFDGLTLSFPRLKVPSGGTVQYELPGGDPEAPDYARSIEAVILYSHDAFAYWPMKKEGGENVPPVCSSLDGKTGIGLPGGACAQCPFNKYETATDSQGNATKGKACKNMKHLYIIRDGDSMPILFSLPPTSLSSFKEFISKNFALRCRPTYASLVRIGLKKVDGANAYSVATFSLVRDFSGEELVAVKKYATTFREQIKNLTASIVKKAQSENVSNVEYDDLPFYDESAEVENIGNSNIDGDREDIPL